jgi:hypothetical protein
MRRFLATRAVTHSLEASLAAWRCCWLSPRFIKREAHALLLSIPEGKPSDILT